MHFGKILLLSALCALVFLAGCGAPEPNPTSQPTAVPTTQPTAIPTTEPTAIPTTEPTAIPTTQPTAIPTTEPTAAPSVVPEEAKIASPDDLEKMRQDPAGEYFLVCDLFLEGGFQPIPSFSGVFHGGNHVIYGLSLSLASERTKTGLILQNTGTIEDLTLSAPKMQIDNLAKDVTAGFFAAENGGTLKNVKITDGEISLTDNFMSGGKTLTFGGLCGKNTGTVSGSATLSADLYSHGLATSGSSGKQIAAFGGAVGENAGICTDLTVQCDLVYNAALMTDNSISRSTMTAYMGGAVGTNDGTVQNASVSGEVTCYFDFNPTPLQFLNAAYVGGIAGKNTGILNNVHSSASLSCNAYYANTDEIAGISE